MLLPAFLASSAIALVAIFGAFFFGDNKKLVGAQRFVVPLTVGILLAFVLYELLPETLAMSPAYGGLVVGLGFMAFYVLSNYLHQRFHAVLNEEDCNRKTAASLLLIGDAVHNLADGVILGAAFLIDPALGITTALAIALHEIPQEIVEFGVLIRAGYSRMEAVVRNLLSASTVVVGTLGTIMFAGYFGEHLWIITGLAAGNLLFVAASELLPKIHGNLKHYGSIWHATFAIIIGFVLMIIIIDWAHEHTPHNHGDEHGHSHLHEEHDDSDHDHEEEEEHHEEHEEEHKEDEHGHEQKAEHSADEHHEEDAVNEEDPSMRIMN
jgi:zinc and cadmium transporter